MSKEIWILETLYVDTSENNNTFGYVCDDVFIGKEDEVKDYCVSFGISTHNYFNFMKPPPLKKYKKAKIITKSKRIIPKVSKKYRWDGR